jgi:hypothetical protein
VQGLYDILHINKGVMDASLFHKSRLIETRCCNSDPSLLAKTFVIIFSKL